MIRAGLAMWVALCCPALADGPALAHVTLGDRTLTLTEVPDDGVDDPLAHPDARLVFAQMHLGFPTPPSLHLDLVWPGEAEDQPERLTHLSLQNADLIWPLGASVIILEIDEVTWNPADGVDLRIEATGFAPGSGASTGLTGHSVIIEVQRRSP